MILDKLATDKAKRDQRLARHKNVYLSLTPVHVSWLSQIEICCIWPEQFSRAAVSQHLGRVATQSESSSPPTTPKAAPMECRKAVLYQGHFKKGCSELCM